MGTRNFTLKVFLSLVALMACASGIAHEAASSEIHDGGPESRVIGSVELRPSWESGSGDMFGENNAELGVQFNRNFQLAYNQEFHHNIRLAEENPEHEGQGLHLETGTLKAHIHNIWKSENRQATLSLEPRMYLPTSTEDREKGFLTAGAAQVILNRQLTEEIGVTLVEAPTLFAYSVAGATVGEEYAANPTFQNLTQIAMNVSLFGNKVTVSLPLLLYFTKHADYESEAELNDAWTTILSVAPEISYEFATGFSTGLALVSPNLLDSAVADHAVNHGRTSTVTQLVLRASL